MMYNSLGFTWGPKPLKTDIVLYILANPSALRKIMDLAVSQFKISNPIDSLPLAIERQINVIFFPFRLFTKLTIRRFCSRQFSSTALHTLPYWPRHSKSFCRQKLMLNSAFSHPWINGRKT